MKCTRTFLRTLTRHRERAAVVVALFAPEPSFPGRLLGGGACTVCASGQYGWEMAAKFSPPRTVIPSLSGLDKLPKVSVLVA